MRNRMLRPSLLLTVAGAVLIVGLLAWQGVTSHGNPDPTARHLTWTAAVVDTGVLVFREGLESILTLAVLTAGLARPRQNYVRPVAAGVGLGLALTLATWFVVVEALTRASGTVPELHLQAATGLLAIVVLLVVMNWFFHKVYWERWLAFHSRRKRQLVGTEGGASPSAAVAWRGLVLLGFASIYREGFEVVLFLQNLRLQVGQGVVGLGALLGAALTAVVAALAFAGHRRVPFQKMLLVTGGMLALVLVVMIGEQAQEMQQAGWIATTTLRWPIPAWMGVWFSVFPTVQTLLSQALALLLVAGSYLAARYSTRRRSTRLVAGAS
jgi:high-affinity iron transporter